MQHFLLVVMILISSAYCAKSEYLCENNSCPDKYERVLGIFYEEIDGSKFEEYKNQCKACQDKNVEFVTPLSILDLAGQAGICNPKDSLIDLGEKEDIYEPVCGISYTHEAKDYNNKFIACYQEDISHYRIGWCN